ncbi:MAG: 16S rRNA (cytosine(967)-C(5))-methyltransferase RsmB [Clostridiaceae bacterium]|nr:16S rRNA (cytosine(967)-C(5))-methyltransferase RsmB [Clostridiaceae bacterium]
MTADSLSVRRICFRLLYDVYYRDSYSNLVLASFLEQHREVSSQDKAFLGAMFYGVLTYTVTLDYYIDKGLTDKNKDLDAKCRVILRMGVWQLLFSHSVPEFAAVNTSVEIAKKEINPGAVRLVNGLLRSLASRREAILSDYEKSPFYVRYALNKEVSGLFIKWFGKQRAQEIAQAYFEKRPISVRANALRIKPNTLIDYLKEEQVEAEPGYFAPDSIRISLGENALRDLKAYENGYFVVQDEAPMMAAVIAEPKPMHQILDLCAAPGGKTTYLAELSGDRASIAAVDLNVSRTKLIDENLERLGIKNVTTYSSDVLKLIEYRPEWALHYDVVLIDVPCSGLGLLGKKPDIRLRANYESIMSLLPLQREMILKASEFVKPGGTLIYCTCTINPLENQEVVAYFLEKTDGSFCSTDLGDILPDQLIQGDENRSEDARNGMITFYPDKDLCDGFFIAKMRRII